MGDPAAERLGCLDTGPHEHSDQPSLGDGAEFLLALEGMNNPHTLLVLVNTADGVCGVAMPEDAGDVGGDEPSRTLLILIGSNPLVPVVERDQCCVGHSFLSFLVSRGVTSTYPIGIYTTTLLWGPQDSSQGA